MIYPLGDYYITGSATVSGILCVSPSSFLYADSNNTVYLKDFGFQDLANVNLSNTIAGIALCGTSSAIVNYPGTSRFDIINFPSMYKTSITTNANASRTSGPHQMAANTSTNFAAATHTTSGKFHIINCIAGTATVFTPSFLTSQFVNAICPKDSNFILGTDLGNIYEVNTSGSLVAGYSLPKTPNNGTTAANIGVTALAYSNGQLLVSCNRGSIFTIQHSASSFLPGGEYVGFEGLYPTGSTTITFSNVVSGTCFANHPAGISGSYKPLTTFWIGNSRPKISNVQSTDNTSNFTWTSISTDGNYIVSSSSSATNSDYRVRVFKLDTSLSYDFTSTRIQFPIGVDIAGSIVRIRDQGIGKTLIDVDQSISANVTNLPAALGNNYIELALVGPASAETWGVRQFTG